MRVMYVGWGWRPRQMGGSILYARFLLEELARQGHEVSYLYNGTHSLLGPPRFRVHREGPLLVQELVNSPLRYYPSANHPAQEAANPVQDRLLAEAVARAQAEVVHFGEFTGWSASSVAAAQQAGARVVVTLMGYVALCPAHFLWRADTGACPGPAQGVRCAACLGYMGAPRRRLLAFEQYLDTYASRPLRVGLRPLRRWLASRWQGRDLLREERPDLAPEYANALQERFAAFAAALRRADGLIAISECTRQRYLAALDLPPDRLRVIRIHTPVATLARPGGPDAVHEPLRFGFLGTFLPHKGVQVLIEAFAQLPPGRAELQLWAPLAGVDAATRARCEALGIDLRGHYEHHQLPEILAGLDVGVVPSLWDECGPLVADEMIRAGLPLVTSDRGGAPELVQHGVNGLIYRGDDPGDLARQLQSLVDNPQRVTEFRRHLPVLPTMAEHAATIAAVYREALTRQP